MIITCPNCNKQFKIDNSLIPDEGRDLQCGSCNNVWFYKIEKKNNEALKLNEENISKDIEIKAEIKEEKINTEISNEKKIKISEKQINPPTSKTNENIGSKFFSYLIVFIISFVALIILLDTLRTPLINGVLRVSIKIINATKDIINTIK